MLLLICILKVCIKNSNRLLVMHYFYFALWKGMVVKMLKKVLYAAASVALIIGISCGMLIPQVIDPIQSSAATNVYLFDYGPGITWGKDDELPTFAPITATKDDPMDAFVANSYMAKSSNTLYSNTSNEVKYAMVTLQGLVNRTRPQIIMMSDAQEGLETWAKELVGEGLYTKTTDYIYMVNKYKSYIKGMIVYNENVTDTMNIATSIAGATDCIVVNSSLAAELKSKCGLSVKLDFNNVSSVTDNISAYNYLYTYYYKTGLLNKRLIIGLNPTSNVTYNRDLAVATKSAVLWLEPNNSNEAAVLDKFYSEAMTGVTYNMGWWPQEDTGVCYATKNGVATIPSDYFENMTVYMAGSKELDIPEVPAKPELENKIYVALAFSDGDNTQYNQHTMKIRWSSSTRQKYPISWTISPALYYCAPQMLNYYYKTAGNSSLISGPSGMGYTKTTRWRYKEGFLSKYTAVTNKVLELTGINIITMWDRISEGTYSEFASGMTALLGATINNNTFNDYDTNWADSMTKGNNASKASNYLTYPNNGEVAYKNNTPLLGLGWPFGYCESVSYMEEALQSLADNFDGNSPVFRLAQFVPWGIQTTELSSMAARLEKEYPGKFEFVRADHMFMLMNEYNGVAYNLALQKTATASYTDSDSSASNGNDGSFTTGWSASYGSDNWYQIDLGQRSNIERYVLKKGSTGYYDASENIQNFTVEYSLNGVDWTTGDTVTNNTDEIVYRDMSAQNARYVRVRIKNSEGTVARIQDLEIYGTAADTADTDELQSLYDSYKELTQGSYSDYVWNLFQKELANTAAVLGNSASTEDDIEQAYSALLAANAALAHDTPATGITVESSVTLKVGEKYSLSASLVPSDTTDNITDWSSSDASVVTVEGGVLTGKKTGNAVVTVTTNRGLSKQVQVTVKLGVTSVALDKTSVNINLGSSTQLEAVITPLLASNKQILWTSSDTSVASVVSGKVTGLKAGTAVITAASVDNSQAYATCKVTVLPSVSGISINKSKATLVAGKTVTLKATAAPANAYNKTVTWKSSNSKIASVNSNGKVTAKSGGKVTITATAGGKSVSCTVIVKPAKVKKLKVTAKNGKLTVKFTKGKGSTFSRVVIYRNNKKWKTVKVTGKSYKVKVTKGKKYSVRVRACKKVGKKTYLSAVTKSKKVKAK